MLFSGSLILSIRWLSRYSAVAGDDGRGGGIMCSPTENGPGGWLELFEAMLGFAWICYIDACNSESEAESMVQARSSCGPLYVRGLGVDCVNVGHVGLGSDINSGLLLWTPKVYSSEE
jgi:hypothetical protein